LPSSIPYLHFNSFLINLQHFYLEIYSNSSYIVIFKNSLAKISQ
jgi:hypothetical protein